MALVKAKEPLHVTLVSLVVRYIPLVDVGVVHQVAGLAEEQILEMEEEEDPTILMLLMAIYLEKMADLALL
jgi:hypothetical protein